MRSTPLLCLAGIFAVALLGDATPAIAKALIVSLGASPSPYSGSCPVTIKFDGHIAGSPGSKVTYQFARVIGGVSSVTPWTSGALDAAGKLAVVDSVSVDAAHAGAESNELRAMPGEAKSKVSFSVTCTQSTPTPRPTSKPSFTLVNPNITAVGTPAPPQKTPPPFTLPPVMNMVQPLRAPINLTSTTSKDVCQLHGGSAGSFACYIGLPAGKLVLVWDYPFSNPIDGYNIYRADSGPSGPTMLVHLGPIAPLATQHDPTIHLIVLDPPQPGACFAVTAFHGGDESNRSARFCVGAGGVAKKISFNPDRVGSWVADYYYWTTKSLLDQSNVQPFIRDLLYVEVGYTHTASLFSDQAHTNVSMYTNSLMRGYVHFSTYALTGHHIAQAQLHLHADHTEAGGETCLAKYGSADHLWNPGDSLSMTSAMGNGPYMGADLSLDVTPLVQSWANGSANYGITLDSGQYSDIYHMHILTSTCLTGYPTISLEVTYY